MLVLFAENIPPASGEIAVITLQDAYSAALS
jgi:hypothetical protein